MIVKVLIMPILVLAISFGIGYWLLISAEGKDFGHKVIGKILGGSLIILAIIATSTSYYFVAKCYYSQQLSQIPINLVVANRPLNRHVYKKCNNNINNKQQVPPEKAVKPTVKQ